MESKKEIYNKIKERLTDYESTPSEKCWKEIENRLAFSNARAYKRKIAWYISAAASVAAITLILFFNGKDTENKLANLSNENRSEITIGKSPLYTDRQIETKENIQPSIQEKRRCLSNEQKQKKLKSDQIEAAKTNEQEIAKNENITQNDTNSIPGNTNSDNDNTIKNKSYNYNDLLNEYKSSAPISNIAKTDKNSYQYVNGISISLVAANTLSTRSNDPNNKLTASSQQLSNELRLYSDKEPLQFKHKMPLSVGLTIEKRWKNNWGIETGLVYTLLRSSYSTESGSQVGDQELHYVGVPIQVTYRFAQIKRFGFYAAAGPKIDFNVSGKRTETAQNELAVNNASETIRDKKPQISLQLRAGAACTLVKHLELYVEPSMAYYINNNGDIPDLWKERPLSFVLQLGLRSSF